MSEDELRQQIQSSGHSVPFLRAMAVTELEKRRQKRTHALMRPSFSLGRVAVGIAMLAAIAAAIAAWFRWGNYVG